MYLQIYPIKYEIIDVFSLFLNISTFKHKIRRVYYRSSYGLSKDVKIMIVDAKLVELFKISDIAFSMGLYMAVSIFANTLKISSIFEFFPIFFSTI